MRGLPAEPPPPVPDRLRALPYFVNSIASGFRSAWIRCSRRTCVDQMMLDDVPAIGPDDRVPAAPADSPLPRAVVLSRGGILLGAIETRDPAPRALDATNPAPQTIRPDMTPALAAKLLQSHPYVLVTTAAGKYLGRYQPRAAAHR